MVVNIQVLLLVSVLNGNSFALIFPHYPIAWTVKRSAVETRVLAVLAVVAHGSGSEHPFNSAGQFLRICAGH